MTAMSKFALSYTQKPGEHLVTRVTLVLWKPSKVSHQTALLAHGRNTWRMPDTWPEGIMKGVRGPVSWKWMVRLVSTRHFPYWDLSDNRGYSGNQTFFWITVSRVLQVFIDHPIWELCYSHLLIPSYAWKQSEVALGRIYIEIKV